MRSTPIRSARPVSQARSVCVSGGDVYAAGSLQSGLTKPLAVVWKNDKAHYTLSDGETPAGVNALCLSGRTLYAAGHSAAPQRSGRTRSCSTP